MNGIVPFWSARSLIAFLIAPVSPALLTSLSVFFILPGEGGNPTIVLRFFAAQFSTIAVIGYPVALLTTAPLYYFVFERMTRVRYRHFFLYALVLSVLINLPIHGGALLDAKYAALPKFVASIFMIGILTTVACTAFYLIIRQPETRGTDADTTDD